MKKTKSKYILKQNRKVKLDKLEDLALKSLILSALIIMVLSGITMVRRANIGVIEPVGACEPEPLNNENTIYMYCSDSIKDSGAKLKCL